MSGVVHSSSSGLCMGDGGEHYMMDGLHIKGSLYVSGLVAEVITLPGGGCDHTPFMATHIGFH